MRKRKFKDKAVQKAYDYYLTERPDPEKERTKGSPGHAYFVGRMDNRADYGFKFRHIPFIVGSICYGAWAAGIDIAREEKAKARKQKSADQGLDRQPEGR